MESDDEQNDWKRRMWEWKWKLKILRTRFQERRCSSDDNRWTQMWRAVSSHHLCHLPLGCHTVHTWCTWLQEENKDTVRFQQQWEDQQLRVTGWTHVSGPDRSSCLGSGISSSVCFWRVCQRFHPGPPAPSSDTLSSFHLNPGSDRWLLDPLACKTYLLRRWIVPKCLSYDTAWSEKKNKGMWLTEVWHTADRSSVGTAERPPSAPPLLLLLSPPAEKRTATAKKDSRLHAQMLNKCIKIWTLTIAFLCTLSPSNTSEH